MTRVLSLKNMAAAPRILPRRMDDILAQRREAALMASHILHRTTHPYRMLQRQSEYEARLTRLAQRIAAMSQDPRSAVAAPLPDRRLA